MKATVPTCSVRRWAKSAIGMAAVLASPVAYGEVRSSATYSIEAETLDGGGGTSSSSSYSNAGSIEPFVAGNSASPSYMILHGFVGAFPEVIVSEYDLWAVARGLVVGIDAGYFDDPNNDGKPNIQHFAFDTDPLGGGSDEGKRTEGVVDVGGGDYLTLTIPVRIGTVFGGNPLLSNPVDGVSYEILGDTDLDDLWELPVEEVIPALDDGLPPLGDYNALLGGDWEYRTFRLTQPLGASPRQFMKAGVTEE